MPDLNDVSFFADAELLNDQELTPEQQVEHIYHLFLSNSLNRPTLYRILTIAAKGSVRLFDLEDQIQALPEFAAATQPPYFLIEWLIKAKALSFTEVDGSGNPITDETRGGKSADEIDDMIDDILIEITNAGREAIRGFDPLDRLSELLQTQPDRYDTYIELLEYLTEKRDYCEIDELLRGRPVLMSGREPGDNPMQPSVFVDKLAAAGGIIFTDGWATTQEGHAFLRSATAATRVLDA